MTKIVSIFLLMLFPFQAMAELPQIAPLNEGDPAPYSGVLYNATAVAETIAQREALIAQHKLNLEILEERLKAECTLQLDNLIADLDLCNQRYNSMVEIKDEQIKNLQDMALEKPNSSWWFIGGIGTGVLLTIGVVYALK
tara:strand:+ start:658 stop:1077 length:420 start_codon:yes stop_codon:yes gene_type:complete